jgi:molybdopterin molybdotransferase
MFVRPILRAAIGSSGGRLTQWLPLADAVDSPAGKHQVRRGTIDADGRVELIGGPSSHLLHSYAVSTVLAHIPAGVDRLEAGQPVEIWRIDV